VRPPPGPGQTGGQGEGRALSLTTKGPCLAQAQRGTRLARAAGACASAACPLVYAACAAPLCSRLLPRGLSEKAVDNARQDLGLLLSQCNQEVGGRAAGLYGARLLLSVRRGRVAGHSCSKHRLLEGAARRWDHKTACASGLHNLGPPCSCEDPTSCGTHPPAPAGCAPQVESVVYEHHQRFLEACKGVEEIEDQVGW
jgi:hypothetical protein